MPEEFDYDSKERWKHDYHLLEGFYDELRKQVAELNALISRLNGEKIALKDKCLALERSNAALKSHARKLKERYELESAEAMSLRRFKNELRGVLNFRRNGSHGMPKAEQRKLLKSRTRVKQFEQCLSKK